MGNIHKQLQLGQTVSLAELATGFRITVVSPEQSGPQVIEVGADYVVLDDAAAGIKTRLPIHLITSVIAPPAPQVEPVALAPVLQPVVAPLAIASEPETAVLPQEVLPDAVVLPPAATPQAA